MKSFFNFFSEARKTATSEKARKLGLSSDGKGGWTNSQGDLVARTMNGELVFTDKKRPQPQERTTSAPKAQAQAPAPTPTSKPPEEEGGDKEGETLTMVFGRFNPPTIGHKKVLDAAAKVAGTGDMVVYPSRSRS